MKNGNFRKGDGNGVYNGTDATFIWSAHPYCNYGGSEGMIIGIDG